MKNSLNDNFRSLLLEEEMKAEFNISKIKIIIYGLLALSQFIEAIYMQKSFALEAYPLLIVFLISILMYFDIQFIFKRPKYHRHFAPINKYLIIFFDILTISVLIYFIFKNIYYSNNPTVQSNQPIFDYNSYHAFLFAIYIFLAMVFMMIDIFRFSVFSSFFLGLLILISYSVNYYLHTSEFSLSGDKFSVNIIIYNILYFSIIVTMSTISALISNHLRKIVVLSKKQERLQRFLPETVAKEFISNKEDFSLEGERKVVTILFTDIRGFTSMSESKEPEEVVQFLNEFMDEMIDVIFIHQGTLDKFLGDGIMAIFGAPVELENSAENALNAAIEMLERLKKFNSTEGNIFNKEISIGIGIHTGEVVLGGIGTDKRMDFTAIGDTVNTASRLQDITKNYNTPVILSESTKEKIRSTIPLGELDRVKLRGKKQEIQIFHILNQ
jgi:adenylate cyclase